jgi:hypothetical protein
MISSGFKTYIDRIKSGIQNVKLIETESTIGVTRGQGRGVGEMMVKELKISDRQEK